MQSPSGKAAVMAVRPHIWHRAASYCNGMRKYSDGQLRAAVAANITMAATLRSLGLVQTSGNYRCVKLRIERLGISVSHWRGSAHAAGSSVNPRVALSAILVEGSSYLAIGRLKTRLIAAGLLSYRCLFCDVNAWNGKSLTLHLDHVNGDPRGAASTAGSMYHEQAVVAA